MQENVQKVPLESKNINIAEISKKYSIETLKYQAAENHLIGNFDENNNYVIYDIIYPELVKIEKTITEITTDHYSATASVNGIKLNFLILLKREGSQISATLNLVENFVIAGMFGNTLTTRIKTITDIDTPNFLYKIRTTFNMKYKNEQDSRNYLEKYISPPIELMGELVRKAEMLKNFERNLDDLEAKYITDMLKELRTNETGRNILKDFFNTVKTNKLSEMKIGRAHLLKQLLDVIIDENLSKNLIAQDHIERIFVIKQNFLDTASKTIANIAKEEKTPLKPNEKETNLMQKVEHNKEKPKENLQPLTKKEESKPSVQKQEQIKVETKKEETVKHSNQPINNKKTLQNSLFNLPPIPPRPEKPKELIRDNKQKKEEKQNLTKTNSDRAEKVVEGKCVIQKELIERMSYALGENSLEKNQILENQPNTLEI